MCDHEQTIVRLREENAKLYEELDQVQSDKEFVWSLWKRLQVSSPDLTQAIAMVVQREKDKAEEKDSKILQILQLKDKKIEELQTIVTRQSAELTALIQQKSDLIDNVKRLEADVFTSSERARQINSQLLSREGDVEDWRRKMIDDVEKQKTDLADRISSLQSELTRLKTDNGDLNAENIALQGRAVTAEREVSRIRNELIEAREENANRIAELEASLGDARCELVTQQKEAITVREEMEKLLLRMETTQSQFDKQSALLTKMETVEESKDTIIRSKDQTHSKVTEELTRVIKSLEAENRKLRAGKGGKRGGKLKSSKGKELDVRGASDQWSDDVDAVNDLDDEDDELTAAVLGLNGTRAHGNRCESVSPVVDMSYRVKRMEQQLRLLQDCLQRRDEVIRVLRESSPAPKNPIQRSSHGAYVRPNRCSRLRSRSAPMRCVRRCLPQESLQRQLLAAERMVADLESVVAEKDEEICSLRQAFDQRGQNMRNLKYRLRRYAGRLNEVLAEKESEDLGRLSAEQIVSVTTELSRLRDSYNGLVVKNSELGEEILRLRKQVQDDDATIRQLDHRLRMEKIPGEADTREKNRIAQDLEQARLKIRLLEEQLRVSDRQNDSALLDVQRSWDCERQGLKTEIDNLARELSSKRIEIANLNRNIKSLGASKDTNKSNVSGAMADILEHFADEVANQSEGADDEEGEEEETDDRSEEEEEGEEEEEAPNPIPVSRPRTKSSRRGVTVTPRRVHWVGNASNQNRNSRSRHMEDLDRVPTREGIPSSDSSRTRTEDSQSARSDGPAAQLASAGIRLSQTGILKRRLTSLQQQLRTLRKSKKQSVTALATLQARSTQMAQALELANARGRRLRTALQQALQSRNVPPATMTNNNARVRDTDESDVSEEASGRVSDVWSLDGDNQAFCGHHGEKDWRALAARARASGAEVIRQAGLLRQLRQEIEAKDTRLSELRERLKRVERDVGQKKSLLEESRAKVKTAEEAAKADREELEVNLQRLRDSRELAERQRVQLESFRRRLSTVTDERRRYEAESVNLRAEAERKTRSASDATAKRQEAEKKAKEAEKEAEEKVAEVARRSEGAVEAARSKVAQMQTRVSRCTRLLLRLSRAVAARAGEANAVAETAAASARRLARRVDSNESMRAARERAADILNISTDDVDAMLHPETVGRFGTRDQTAEREWLRRCERLLSSGGPSDDEEAEALARSFDEKLADMLSVLRAAAGIAQA